MPAALCLGVDVGSTSTKVSLVAVGTAVTELGTLSVATPDDAGELVATVGRMIASLAEGRAIDAVGVASMAETGVPLDAAGAPLAGLIRWDGTRSVGVAPDLFAVTGVPLTPKPPLVSWLTTDYGMARWAGVADLIVLALTGELVTDHTLAGRTMAYRLPDGDGELAHEFDAELLALASLTPGHLPEVILHGDGWPLVSTAGASLTGLTVGTPVVVAGHDHAVGAWGARARFAGDVIDSVGTTEVVMTVLGGWADRAAVAPTGMSIVRTVEGDREAILAGSAAAGAAVRWWVEQEYEGSMDALIADLSTDAPRSQAIVLPYPAGRQSPHPDPAQRLEVLDAAESSRAQRTIALFDALSFQARWMLDVQSELAGTRPRAVTMLGGATASNLNWMTTKSALMPPLRIVDAAEPVAASAALLAAVRAGLADPETSLGATRPDRSRLALESHYRRFVAAALGERK